MSRPASPSARPFWRLAVCLLALFALLAGCSSDDSSSDDTDSTEGSDETTTSAGDDGAKIVKIGVIAPLEDGLTAYGLGIKNSVELAVDQANENDAVPGWTIEVVALDDSSDPEKGKAAAEEMAKDDDVIGVVGTYNSGVAAEVAPILEEAGIPMITPGNTNPALSIGEDRSSPTRQFSNYFRLVATDAQQGPFLAAYAEEELSALRVAVVSETKPVSKGLADDFSAAYTALGGEIVFTEVVADGTSDFSTQVAAIAPLTPDLVFFGGEYEVAASLREQATAAGITAPLMGGDGIKDDLYIENAADAAEGDYASGVGAPLDSLETATDYLAAYESAGFEDPPSDYGPYAYDAANLLISAAADTLPEADAVTSDVREEVIAIVQVAEVEGVTGEISFDEFGDTTNRVLTIYRVEDGAFAAVLTRKVD